MQKAMFLAESFRKGIIQEIDAGYILTVNVPDFNDNERILDPLRVEMISYSGVRSVQPVENGLMFRSAGRKIVCMIEPVAYTNRHVEPAFRATDSTEQMPYRFSECEIYRTRNDKYRVLLPREPIEYLDSFTVEFPRHGDVSVLYFVFDDDVDNVVIPYIQKSLERILRNIAKLPAPEISRIGTAFMDNVRRDRLSVRTMDATG